MDLRFTANNGIVDVAIKELLDLVGPIRHRSIVREMIIAATDLQEGFMFPKLIIL